MKTISTFFLCLLVSSALAQVNIKKFEQGETLTHEEVLTAYKALDDAYPQAKLMSLGQADVGRPMSVFVISENENFDPQQLKKQGKGILLINNGIHAGEPCGIDASVNLATNILNGSSASKTALKDVVVVIIPAYNIGGVLNRGCCSRANQVGPVEHGFRGNAKNLDLNRDFIKNDSRNAKAFAQIFHSWDPDLFVDTHTSNGADYQYTMTLISTQKDKLNPHLASYMEGKLVPHLFEKMAPTYPMTPYVYSMEKTPDGGIKDFLETPRFASGYAALFNTISFITETHMLKPFKDRVQSTYNFLEILVAYFGSNKSAVLKARNAAVEATKSQAYFDLQWGIDSSRSEKIDFRGYEATYQPSKVTGKQRLFYDHDQPYEKVISYFHTYRALDSAKKPNYYIVPQAWERVVERLELNNIRMQRLTQDSTVEVQVSYITDYETRPSPYEHHYLHSKVQTREEMQSIQYFKGDYLIPVNQAHNRYIVETLEPKGVDSFFAWNFFDAILQQKEWFSPYVFEDIAAKMLEEDPKLKAEFEQEKENNKDFANNQWAQLYYLYKKSPHYEKSHNRYPVGRIF